MAFASVAQSQDPIPKDELKMIQARYAAQEKAASARLRKNPDDLSAYSARGDARLFLGNFQGSREDYEKMIELNPKLGRFPLEAWHRLLLFEGIRQGRSAIQDLSQLRSSGSGEWNLAVHVPVQSKRAEDRPQRFAQVREGRSSALPLAIRNVCGKDQTRAGFFGNRGCRV